MIYLKTGFELVPGHILYILHIAALFSISYQLYKFRKQSNSKTSTEIYLEQARTDMEVTKCE
jgi:hypothetical protein